MTNGWGTFFAVIEFTLKVYLATGNVKVASAEDRWMKYGSKDCIFLFPLQYFKQLFLLPPLQSGDKKFIVTTITFHRKDNHF